MRLPKRLPPEEVLSIDADGEIQLLEVPEDQRVLPASEDAASSDSSMLQAWERFVASEAERIELEMRCRDRLALDLNIVEADLAADLQPSIPIDLMGMTLLSCGKRCMLPYPEGDCLKFRIWEGSDDLASWTEEMRQKCKELWSNDEARDKAKKLQLEKEKEEVFQRFRELFACSDTCHARGVLAVERAELHRAGYAEHGIHRELRQETIDSMEEELKAALSGFPELSAVNSSELHEPPPPPPPFESAY
eukprot:TRINITY_DN5925_c0_g1_i5.p1 TRINITY_DN5925_c0_g1~~TRINITY_DN5925_c0_g1_i5.p1  ORF type:complete len:249 (-),score=64.97 TRINITY_DN5925_c0_g1_i5:256-1002(-)